MGTLLAAGEDAAHRAAGVASRRRTPSAWLIAWIAVLPVALIRARVLAESDTFWEIRTGQVILRGWRIPVADSFSWWARGRPWTPNSWAFDVLLASGYRAGGLACVALIGSALVLAACAAVLLLARRLGGSAPAAGLLVFAGAVWIFLWLSVRPQLIDYAAVPVLLLAATSAGPALRARSLLIIAVIEAVWVNLHTAALLGIVVLLCAGLGGQICAVRTLPAHGRRRMLPQAGVRALVPALAALAGALANPRGAAIFQQLRDVSSSSAGLVAEWHHVSPTSPSQLAMLGTGLLAAAVAARRGRWDLVFVLGALAACGAYAIRILPILDAVAVAVLAVALNGPRLRAWAAERRRTLVLRFMAAGIVAALAVLAATGLPHLGETSYPAGSVSVLPSGCRLFNSYLLGGIVILLRPDVPVSLDSRNDLYGRQDVLTEQRILTSHSGGPGTLRRLGVTCVLIPAGSGLARQLERSPGWRQVTSYPAGAVFLRRPSWPATGQRALPPGSLVTGSEYPPGLRPGARSGRRRAGTARS
jgi:hypothetical protein